MKTLAIIGLGAVVRNIHAPAYATLSDRVRIIAGCDPDGWARARAQKELRIPEVFENPREMLEVKKPDVVSICTPPWLHCEHALLGLGHGCHVFCEKPLADTLTQADELIDASERAGRLVVVNNQFPYMKIHQAAKKMIGTQQFGGLLYLHAWHTMRTTSATEAGWRGQLQRRLGFDFGVHVLDLVRFFFDDNPVKLFAHMPNPRARAQCDVVNVINLEFADGCAASIVLDRLSRGPERYLDLRLDGEYAAVHTSIGGRIRFTAGVHTREKRPYLDLTLVKGGRAVLQDGNRETVIAKDGINPFGDATAHHFASFLAAIESGRQPPGNVRDNRNTLALVMGAYESAELGRWVEINYEVPDRNKNPFRMMSAAQPGLKLSIVIAAWNGVDSLDRCLGSLGGDLLAGDTEVITAANFDTTGLRETFPRVQFLGLPLSTTVPTLRSTGIARSRGEIVALAEDHCTFGEDWCRAIKQAHVRPHAAIGGAVENASTTSAVDWAVYFYDYGKFMLPGESGMVEALPGNNVSYKRQVLQEVELTFCDGFFEPFAHGEIVKRGHVLYWDSSAVVYHQKRYRAGDTLKLFYHMARSYAAMRVAGMSFVRRYTFALASLALPLMLTGRVVLRTVKKGRHLGALLRSLPYLMLLATSWSFGELCGYIAGEGTSAMRWK